MKLGKRSRWIIIFAILLMSLAISLTQVDAVQATFDDMHVATVLLRVETEIMQKTPAGQYYDSLFWKHSDEVVQIMMVHPEHKEVLLHAIRVFIPELEALLDGNGDSVHITAEHVENLKAELDWFSARGSPALSEDIQKEQQRFPLYKFVGMTMSEALGFIKKSWTPDKVTQQTSVPDPGVLQTPLPNVVVQEDPTPESVGKQTLVPGFNGKWAYYVHNGIYFESPTTGYYLLSEPDAGIFDFVLSGGVAEQADPYEILVHIWNQSYAERDKLSPEYWYPAKSVIWEGDIRNQDFEGFEFISRMPSTQGVNLNAVQYNQKNQIAVHVVCMYIDKDPLFPNGSDYSAIINQRYKYFQHIVDSLHLQTP